MALEILPLGLHRLGMDGPETAAELGAPPVIGAEDFDAETKDLASVTGSADPVDAQVAIALTRLRRSGAAVMADGQRFQDIRKLDENAPILLEQEARTALKRLVDNGDIRIERIDVETDSPGCWAEVTVNYFNQRLPKPESRSITVPIRPEATS